MLEYGAAPSLARGRRACVEELIKGGMAGKRQRQERAREEQTSSATASASSVQQPKRSSSSLVRFHEDKEHGQFKQRLLSKYASVKASSSSSTHKTTKAQSNVAKNAKKPKITLKAVSEDASDEGENAEVAAQTRNPSEHSDLEFKHDELRSASGITHASASSEESASHASIGISSSVLERQASHSNHSISSDDGASSISQSRREFAARTKRYLEQYEVESASRDRLLINADQKTSDVEAFEAMMARSASETARLIAASSQKTSIVGLDKNLSNSDFQGSQGSQDSQGSQAGLSAKIDLQFQEIRNIKAAHKSRLEQHQQEPTNQRKTVSKMHMADLVRRQMHDEDDLVDSDEDELQFRPIRRSKNASSKRARPSRMSQKLHPQRAVPRNDARSQSKTLDGSFGGISSISAFLGSALAKNERNGPSAKRRRRRAGLVPISKAQTSFVEETGEIEEIEDLDDDPGMLPEDYSATAPYPSQSNRIKHEPGHTHSPPSDIEDTPIQVEQESSNKDMNSGPKYSHVHEPDQRNDSHTRTGSRWIATELHKQEQPSRSAETVAALLRKDQAIHMNHKRRDNKSDTAKSASHRRIASSASYANRQSGIVGRLQSLMSKARSKFSQRLSEQAHCEDFELDSAYCEVYVSKAARSGRHVVLDAIVISVDDGRKQKCDSLQSFELIPGLPVRVLLPRMGVHESIAESPSGAGAVFHDLDGAHEPSTYHLISKQLQELGHLKGAEVASDLNECLVSLRWPWVVIPHTSSIESRHSTIVASGLVTIKQHNASRPEALPTKDWAKSKETRPSSVVMTKEARKTGVCANDSSAKSEQVERETAIPSQDEEVWQSLLEPSSPRKTIENLRGYIVATVLRDALVVENGEAILEANLAPPATRYSSILVASPLTLSETQQWFCEILVAPQHVFQFMGAISEGNGSLFEFSKLRTVCSRPFSGRETRRPQRIQKHINWSDYLSAASNILVHQSCISTLLLPADASTTLLESTIHASLFPILPSATLYFENVQRRCNLLCRVLYPAKKGFFVSPWTEASSCTVCHLYIPDARMNATVKDVGIVGGWLYVRSVLQETRFTFCTDSLSVVEVLKWAPEGGLKRTVETEMKSAPSRIGKMVLSSYSSSLEEKQNNYTVSWCRSEDHPGVIPDDPDRTGFSGVVNGQGNATQVLPLLFRFVELPKAFERSLSLPVELNVLQFSKSRQLEDEETNQSDEIGYVKGTIRRIGWAKKTQANCQTARWRFSISSEVISVLQAQEASGTYFAMEVVSAEGRKVKVRARPPEVQNILENLNDEEISNDSDLGLLLKGVSIKLPCYAQSICKAYVTLISLVDEHGSSLL